MKVQAIFLILCCSSVVYANSACDKPKNNFDDLYCLRKVYQQADEELNNNYQKLNAVLDADGRKTLKSGQLAWIKTRNESCSKYDEQQGFFVNINCATTTTIKRSQFLQDRLRECASSGCQNSKL